MQRLDLLGVGAGDVGVGIDVHRADLGPAEGEDVAEAAGGDLPVRPRGTVGERSPFAAFDDDAVAGDHDVQTLDVMLDAAETDPKPAGELDHVLPAATVTELGEEKLDVVGVEVEQSGVAVIDHPEVLLDDLHALCVQILGNSLVMRCTLLCVVFESGKSKMNRRTSVTRGLGRTAQGRLNPMLTCDPRSTGARVSN